MQIQNSKLLFLINTEFKDEGEKQYVIHGSYLNSWIKQTIPLIISEQPEDRNCACCPKCCLCYHPWVKFQNFMFRVTHDMLFESAVTICIILNTAFLAAEHHGMSPELKHVLEIGNKVFTTFFTAEAALKLLALSKE